MSGPAGAAASASSFAGSRSWFSAQDLIAAPRDSAEHRFA